MLASFAVARGAEPVDLPALATAQGFAASRAALDAIVADAHGRKLERRLAEAGLERVAMPVRAFRGAELVFTSAGPVTGCRWDGDLSCRASVATAAPVRDGEYEFTCRSSLGALAKMPSRLVEASDGEAVFEVSGMRACWDLGIELLVHPTASGALEGVGEGTDLIPPELTGLTRTQVEDEITSRLPLFKHCLVTAGAVGLTGKLVVAYRIGADGAIASAEVETSSITDAAVGTCILERFRSLTFPKPMGGWDSGTYPFTFQ